MPLAVCATPIGNLEDVTLRVLRELAEADVVLCEDTRQTRKLLERHGIRARLLSYHRHNEARRTGELLPRLEAGERIALVSDSGLPGVSDPGARLVRAARERGVAVTVLPGPSAAVAFESPQRLSASLRVLARVSPEREAAVCRELTKRFEEIAVGPLAELAERFSGEVKGEVTLVLGPAQAPPKEEGVAAAAVAELVAAGLARRKAAEVVARLTGVPRNRLYRESL